MPGRCTNCPYGGECFVEKSREIARGSQLIVTNHALLAIDAMHGGTALPEHSRLIIDEAHELVARVTGAASMELSPQQVERVAKRCLTWLDDDLGVEFLNVADDLGAALLDAPLDRIEDPDAEVIAVLSLVADVSRRVVSALPSDDPDAKQASAAAKEVHDAASAMATLKPTDVVYVSERERFGRCRPGPARRRRPAAGAGPEPDADRPDLGHPQARGRLRSGRVQRGAAPRRARCRTGRRRRRPDLDRSGRGLAV